MEVGGIKKETFKKEGDDFFLGGCVLLEGGRKIQLEEEHCKFLKNGERERRVKKS